MKPSERIAALSEEVTRKLEAIAVDATNADLVKVGLEPITREELLSGGAEAEAALTTIRTSAAIGAIIGYLDEQHEERLKREGSVDLSGAQKGDD